MSPVRLEINLSAQLIKYGGVVMQEGDKGIAMNVGKTVLVLIGFMLVIIAISNIIA